MSLDLATEIAIAPALDAARNKFATSHVNAALADLIATIVKHGAPAFGLHPSPADYDNAAETLVAIHRAVDAFTYAVMAEAETNARTNINAREYVSVASDALHDSDALFDLECEAQDLREVEVEDVS